MSRHVTSCNVTSRLATSCHVMPRHVVSRHVTSRHVMLRRGTSCHVESLGTVTRPTLHCQLTFSTRNSFELSMTVFVGCPEGCRFHTALAVYDLVLVCFCSVQIFNFIYKQVSCYNYYSNINPEFLDNGRWLNAGSVTKSRSQPITARGSGGAL